MLERKFKKLVESYPNLVDGRFAISKAKHRCTRGTNKIK